MEILDADELEQVPVPSDAAAAERLRHLRLLVGGGAARLIANADVSVRALRTGAILRPVVLPNPLVANAATCSPVTWYARYRADEVAKRRGRLAGWLEGARGSPLSLVAEIGDLDRVVYVDNWLLATAPGPVIDVAGATAVSRRLAELHPDRAVVWRGVTPALDGASAQALELAGCLPVRSRTVLLLDARDGGHRRHHNVRIDEARLARSRYEIVAEAERLVPHAARMAELYRAVYVDRYTAYNPQLGAGFFTATLSNGVLSYRGLVRDGRLDAFVAFWPGESTTWSCLLGHDTALGREVGLYRMLIAILIRESAERRTVLHLGSGSADFKRLRGAEPADELDAVHVAHLSPRRRLAWRILAAASNRHRLAPAAVGEPSLQRG